MNVERIKLVNQVFDKIDSNRDNYITINEIKNSFYPRNHPDVKTGRKGEEEILAELLDTLEVYQILNVKQNNLNIKN